VARVLRRGLLVLIGGRVVAALGLHRATDVIDGFRDARGWPAGTRPAVPSLPRLAPSPLISCIAGALTGQS
jgi:hypothetical protein